MSQPIQHQDRLISLDIIRGIALMGIAMLNALLMAYPQHFYNPLAFPLLNQADKAVELSLMLIVRTSFYPIFSFLFGAGIALQYAKLSTKADGFFVRRYGFLLGIGVLHGCFIWMGDILTLYAVAAFVLLLFVKLDTRFKLLLGLVLTLGSFVMIKFGVQAVLQLFPFRLELSQLLDVYAFGNFLEVTKLRSYEFFYFELISLVYVLPQVLGLFLLGMVAVETGFFRYRYSFKQLRPLMIALVFIALLKLPRLYFAAYGENPASWRHVSVIFGGPALGGLYVIGTVLGLRRVRGARAVAALTLFADAGRMALSNYLTQSIVLTSIFYGYGFGLYASWGSLYIVLLALSLFMVQLIFSKFWLQRFKYGPFEWLWRSFSYGRWMDIKK